MIDVTRLDDLEALARERLTPNAYDYIAGGSDDEYTLRENRAAFARIPLLPRVLVDVRDRQLATTLLGHQMSMPVLVAPMGFQALNHPDGECAVARAAAESGVTMVVSTAANYSLEQVAAAAPDAPRWFQLYVYRDREVTRDLVQRAAAAGYKALCVTVDTPLVGRRERDVRNHFTLPPGLRLANFEAATANMPTSDSDSGLAAYVASLWEPSFTWKDLEWLQSLSSLPIVLKGILHPEDARLAVEHGASAVVVSNHGGRQLDTVPATITVLPKVAEAVNGQIDVLIDGGIRHGTDVLKALALGAQAVLLGRPVLWSLALEGQAGVAQVLAMLRAEIELAMALSGCTDVNTVPSSLIYRA